MTLICEVVWEITKDVRLKSVPVLPYTHIVKSSDFKMVFNVEENQILISNLKVKVEKF